MYQSGMIMIIMIIIDDPKMTKVLTDEPCVHIEWFGFLFVKISFFNFLFLGQGLKFPHSESLSLMHSQFY